MRVFEVVLLEGWNASFDKLDATQQRQIWKKIEQLKSLENARHLKHGLPYFVVETGQYRIAFEQNANKRGVHFTGTHKQYEQWLREL